jgi:hypothetical protein
MNLRQLAVAYMAKKRKQGAIKVYTETRLNSPEHCSEEKKKIVALNQGNRLDIIKRVQEHTLVNLFKKIPEFYTDDYHYDWWAFPMHIPKAWNWQAWNYDASVDLDEAQILLFDKEFVANYKSCITLYLDALDENGWNNYPVRFARLLHSLSLFTKAVSGIKDMKDEYANLYKLGMRAVAYAEKNIMDDNSKYGLLQDGFKKMVKELDQFEQPVVAAGYSLA